MSINMTGGIPTWFVDKFSDDLYHACQQKDSKFGAAVVVDTDLSANEDKAFDMIDSFSLQEKTGRSPKTPTLDPSTQRRWVNTTPYHQSILYDMDDDLDIKLSPAGDFVELFSNAVRRKKDDIILASFEASVSSGRRAGSSITWGSQDGNVKYTGKDTGRTIQWDCAVGNCSASDVGMTVEKVQLIHEYFLNNDCDENIPKWCAISPRQATNLWGQEEYVNIDYNESKPLASARILKNWMGLNWIISPKIEIGTSNDVDGDKAVFECWAWQQDAIILGVADELTIKISEDQDYSYSQRVYVHMNMGAIRRDEDKVIKIECAV